MGGLLRLILLLAALLPGSAAAAPFDDALARLASSKFADVEAGVEELARSGDPRAGAVLAALADGRLLLEAAGKRLFVQEPVGGLVDAATGAAASPAPPATALKPVRLNNRVRRALDAARGGFDLTSPDPARRTAAALSVLRGRDAGSLPAVEAALAAEQDPGVKDALAAARAGIVVALPTAAEADRLAAAATLSARADQAAIAILGSLPADTPEAVRAAAADGVAAVQTRLRLVAIGQNVLFGVSLGSVLLLAAIGLAITFGVMGVINMAHGEMVMLGAYTTFALQELCRTYFPAGLGASVVVALPAAFLVAGAMGVLIERGVISRLYGRPLETLLATFGISLILQQLVRSLFGPNNREVATPAWMSGSVELAAGFGLTLNRLVIIVFCLAVFAALLVILRRTHFGLEMRAVTQNRRMAAAMGIRTGRVDALTFGLGSGIAGVAGVALAQIDNVSPNLGQGYIIDSFMVVVFGGVGNLWGTLTGAFTLGIVNKLLEPAVGAVLAKILVLVAIILFIQKRPRGLFALRGRAVES